VTRSSGFLSGASFILLAVVSSACTVEDDIEATLKPIDPATTVPSSTSNPKRAATTTPSFAPSSTRTPSPTITSSATPIAFAPEHFGFPVAFEGDFALAQKLGYAPCYHWNPEDYDPLMITENNWYYFFHAGDMYILNLSSSPQRIVVLSPVSGVIKDSYSIGPGEISVIIQTEYYFEGKQVYVGIHHITEFFLGDKQYPAVNVGSSVIKGQPIGIQEKVAEYRPEQPLDIEITKGRPETNHPLYPGWDPDIFIDPFLYLEDDLAQFGEHIYFDYYRDHCLKGGHFP
jgi:hypothetical protein